jgi:hypothetical protein
MRSSAAPTRPAPTMVTSWTGEEEAAVALLPLLIVACGLI